MAGKYISRYTGEEIDEALGKALLFDPSSNGWIYISSSPDDKIDLDELTSNGNFIVDYCSNKPQELQDISPINLSVFDKDDQMYQSITLMDNVYYRQYNRNTGEYTPWKTKKTTNTVYIDEVPQEPTENTIIIVKNDIGNYVMKIFDGDAWVQVGPENVMYESVYDPQGRKTDFFKYVDDMFKELSLGGFGLEWEASSLSTITKKFSCCRIDWNDNIIGILENSATMVIINSDGIIDHTIDLPVIMSDGQFTICSDESNSYIVIYDNFASVMYKGLLDKDTMTVATFEEIPSIGISGTTVDTYIGIQGGALTEDNNGVFVFIHVSDQGYFYIKLKMDQTYDVYGRSYSIERMMQYTTEMSIINLIMEMLHIESDNHFWLERGVCNYIANDQVERFDEDGNISKDMECLQMTYSSFITRESSIEEGYLSIICETRADLDKMNQNKTDIENLSVGEIYDKYYRLGLFLSYYNVDEMTTKDISIDLSDPYILLSNPKEYMGSYVIYGLTFFGRIDQINIIPDIDLIDIYEFSYVEQGTNIDWQFMHLTDNYLRLVGARNEEEPYEIFISTTDKSADILSVITDHIKDRSIHFSDEDRAILLTRETKENVEVKFNRTELRVKEYADAITKEAIEDGHNLEAAFDKLEEEYQAHIADLTKHPNAEERAYWDAKAEPDHTHILDGKVKIHANQVSGGKLDISLIPEGAKELVVKVQTYDEMLNLTIDTVQNGDRVAIMDGSGIYEVVDESKLAYTDEATSELIPASEDAFYECSAGSGVFIHWKNVENTPTTIAGYGIDDTYTRPVFDNLLASLIADETKKLEDRYATFDLDELYNTIDDTKQNIDRIKSEIEDAISITQDVRELEIKVKEQNLRMIAMSEDLTEAQLIVTELLSLYS